MDKSNKENVSTIKPDVHNLSMEPLQMKKKKKKIDGYNLRKSFAWNKSFFTDEGVLDPIELSLLSGTCTDTSGGGLCSIEERRTPQSRNSRKNFSSSSKSIKKNLSNEINATSSKEDTAKSSCKALATRNDRTSSTGGVCHRPLFSTPLTRPANINVSKASVKESKLPKFQVLKAGSCPSSTPSNCTIPRARSMQNKKISDRVSVLRKNVLRSSIRNGRKGQNKANDDSKFPPDLPIASSHLKGDSEKTKDISTANIIISNTSSLSPVKKNGNTSLKVTPDPVVSYSTSVCSSQCQEASVQATVSHLHNTFNLVRNMQHSQIQTMRPSGLRMPSPSLRFFRQSDASEAHQLSQRNAEFSVEKLQETGDLRSLCAFADQRVTGNTPTMYTGDNVCTQMECSVVTSSQQAIKSCSGYDAALNKLKIVCDSKNPKLVSNKNGDHNVCSVNGNVNDTEPWINGLELVDTGDCGHVSEEDQKIIGSQGCRGSSRSDLENYQSVFQKNCTTHPMDTFRGETLVNSSDVVNMASNSVVSFECSFSDFKSGNILMCGGEKTISTSHEGDMQEVHCSPEEQSDNKSCSFDFLSHESQDSEDPNLVGLSSAKVEPDDMAFTVEDLHILSSEENITSEGNDKSDSGDSVLHTAKDIMSAQSCNSTPHVFLMEDFPAKERDKCSDCFNKESQTVKLNDSNFLKDCKKCELVNVSENVDPCNAISADKFEQSDAPTFDFALTGQDTSTVSEESERTRDLGSAPEPSDGAGIVRSSSFNVEPVLGGIDAKTELFDVDSTVHNKPLSYLGNPSMPEDAELLSDSVLLRDSEINGNSASVNIDSSTQTSKMCISTASTTCMGLVESDWESSMNNHGVCMQDQIILGNESQASTSTNINSHATDFCVELGDAKRVTNNKTDIVSNKRTKDGKKKSDLRLIPPRNAVPFSDEWFAAVEAAGEDVLTMKGGAVQNSPPDKSLPEPSPWSPVRRKNNEVGPHDCTKYTRNMAGPSDS